MNRDIMSTSLERFSKGPEVFHVFIFYVTGKLFTVNSTLLKKWTKLNVRTNTNTGNGPEQYPQSMFGYPCSHKHLLYKQDK